MVINRFGSYKILSSPLRNDHENSKKHKIDWIGRKLKIKPSETIISSNKGAFATQPDGTPNILIDDLGRNIQNWMNNGGLGIKYQADEDSLSKVQRWLSQFYSLSFQEYRCGLQTISQKFCRCLKLPWCFVSLLYV